MGDSERSLEEHQEGESKEPSLEAVRFAVQTDVGVKREENQDFYGVIRNDSILFPIVADGMGGAKGGATASRTAIELLEESIDSESEVDCKFLCDVIVEANTQLYKLGASDPSLTGMGTTLVGIVFTTHSYTVVNVGDSRAFRIRHGVIEQLTEDHTLINELIRSGALNEAQAANHPISHMLTRSLGPAENVQPDCFTFEDGPRGGDIFILCSDGLYNHVGAEDIRDLCLNSSDLDVVVKELVDLANDRGGTDNITVVVVQFPDEFGPHLDIPQDDTVELEKSPEASTLTNGLHVGKDVDAVEDDVSIDPHSPEIGESIPVSELSARGAAAERKGVEHDTSSEGTLNSDVQREAGTSGTLKYFYAVLGSALLTTIIISYFPLWQRSADESYGTHTQLDLTEASSVDDAPQQVARSATPIEVPDDSQMIPSDSRDAVSDTDDLSGHAVRTPQFVESPAQYIAELSERVAILELRLRAFDEPLSGRLSELLVESELRLTELNEQLEEMRSSIDIASRRLAVWFGRRKRLQRMAPINLAAEVSVSSEAVRAQKEEFDRVTWELLKAEEERRYDPNNEALKAKSSELTLQRNVAMNRLGVVIERAIDEVLTNTDREISELSARRDVLEKTRDRLVDDRAFARVLLRGTDAEKQLLRTEYEHELTFLRAELDSIRRRNTQANGSGEE